MTMLEHTRRLYTVLFTHLKVFFAVIVLITLGTKVFAKAETIIITLKVNEAYLYDYEVVVDENEAFSLPVKATADVLKIKYDQNHFTNEITILDKVLKPDDKNIILIKQGILDETRNELFMPVEQIKDLFNEYFKVDLTEYSIVLTTDREIEKPLQATVYEDNFYPEYKKDTNLVLPGKKPFFSLDSVKVNEVLQTDYTSESNLGITRTEELVNNNAQAALTGKLYGGQYKIRTNLRSYDAEPFSFGGLNFNYEKDWKKYRLELGNISSLKISNITAAERILGVKLGNDPQKVIKTPNFSELVNKEGDLNLFVNEKFVKTTTVEEFKQEKLQNIPLVQEPQKRKYELIAGITGYEDNFFSNYELENDATAKKIVTGLTYSGKLTDKLSFETLGVGDYIFSTPATCDYSSILSSQIPLLALNINKSFRCQHGVSTIASIKHNTFNDFFITADIGGSFSDNKQADNSQKIDSSGYLGAINFKYEKPDWKIYTGVYDYSPDFYLAGSSGISGSSAFVNDKRGFKVGGDYKHRFISMRGELNKYNSNLDDYLLGGEFKFLDYNFRVKVPVTRRGYISYYRRSREGTNNAGEITSYLNRLDYNQRITSRLNFSLNGVYNKFISAYSDSAQSQNSYRSKYSTFTARSDYRLPKNIGTISVAHEISKTNAGDFKKDNNTIRLGYTFPRFLNIGTTVFVGYKYKGDENNIDLSVDMDYMFHSGRTLGFVYQYNRQSGLFFDDLYIPKTSRHSFMVNISDVYSLVEGKLRPDGFYNEKNGYLKVTTFLDVNRDGILNDGEPKIPAIPFKISGNKDSVYTNKKGQYLSKSMAEGLYDVTVNYHDLPTLLSVSPGSHNEYTAKIEQQNTTRINVGLISSVGNVSGMLLITDDFGRHINIKDLVIIITDENGEEVDYTTVSEGESYYLAGLSPGTYTLSVDKNFLKAYNLVAKDGVKKVITIPPVFDDYFDVEGFDLEYLQTFEEL